jgi:DNA (cytosine-5)-methyltransferase 1
MLTLSTDLDCIDLYCGAGGESTGLVEAGWNIKVAANHDEVAIATHAANHPNTEHLCADVQTIDFRYLPRTRALWASPICTEVSPAGGKSKRRQGGPSLFEEYGHVPSAAFERTRVTFWEVLRAVEVWRYEVVFIENVVESFDWELMPTWMAGMETLGYTVQIVCVSAAHVGGEHNPNAPQYRSRIFHVWRRKGMAPFQLDLTPPAWCAEHGVVEGLQAWKPTKNPKGWRGQRVGKYDQQYLYACPRCGKRAEPYVMPAAEAIDWTNLGQRIGDRKRPLATKTMRRVEMGLDLISNPVVVAAAGNTWDSAAGSGNHYLRATSPDSWPLAAQTGTAQLGIAGFIVPAGGSWRDTPDLLTEPMRTRTTSDNDALVLAPEAARFLMSVNHDTPRYADPDHQPFSARTTKMGDALVMAEPFVTMLRNHGRSHPVTDALPTFTGHGFHHALVVPFRRGATPHSTRTPLSTMATHTQHGLMLTPERPAIEDCWFRMLTPRESANAQRFPKDYKILGTRGHQQLQAGNAVPVNVAHWLGASVAEGLDAA